MGATDGAPALSRSRAAVHAGSLRLGDPLRGARRGVAHRALATTVAGIALLAPGAGGRAAERIDPRARLSVERIEFEGLRRYAREQALGASGLSPGQVIQIGQVATAQQRLLDSGLFTSVSSRHVVTGDRLEVTFKVTEIAWDTPVVFDNFVWLDDSDLAAEVARKVPSFEGTAPRTGGVLESIRGRLDELLAARGIGGSAELRQNYAESGDLIAHRYLIVGVDLPLCRVVFHGAAAVDAEELEGRIGVLVGKPYTRASLTDSIALNLMPLYGRKGYLRAAFAEPKSALSRSPDCRGGVEAAVTVTEGSPYRLGDLTWTGNSAFESPQLTARLGLEPGAVVDTLRLDGGLKKISEDHARLGLLEVRLSTAVSLDDRTLSAAYTIAVSEGPQYRMGALALTGLSEQDTLQVTQLWKLGSGVVYDAPYAAAFGRQVLARLAGPQTKVRTRASPDRGSRTVDVTLTFE